MLPLVELRSDFVVESQELFDTERGRATLSWQDSTRCPGARPRPRTRQYSTVGGRPKSSESPIGIAEAASASPLGLGGYSGNLARVAKTVELMLSQGIGGPYGVAAGPETYTA